MSLDPSANPKCRHCGSLDIDNQLKTFFGVFVCAKDKAERPDEYSLLTKTECKEDYLLTECKPNGESAVGSLGSTATRRRRGEERADTGHAVPVLYS
jgi:DNA-repair protein complementing XP-A cells